jgi:serine/threonine-protein kinase
LSAFSVNGPDLPGRSAPDLADALGEDFDVLRTLGSGSVATVFLAREKALSRLVAIKVMDPATAGDETARRRFEREARAMASLSDHPRIAGVHRFGQLPDGSPFIVMRYVKGKTLEERLAAEGSLPLEQALEALEDVCDALAVAHSKGIVHRDIRPGNVMWDEASDRGVLTDFGIAAILSTADHDATRLTSMGERIGNPKYMSPERLRDEEITEASDMYAVGVLGYEILTGEGPYEADTMAEWIRAHLKDDPKELGRDRPDIPSAVRDLLKHCLDRTPNHRPTASDALRVLRRGEPRLPDPGDVHDPAPEEEEGGLATAVRKRVPQTVALTVAGAWLLAQFTSGFDDPRLYSASLVVGATAVAVAGVIAWFHGERGHQKAPALEYVILAVLIAGGLAISGLVYFTP